MACLGGSAVCGLRKPRSCFCSLTAVTVRKTSRGRGFSRSKFQHSAKDGYLEDIETRNTDLLFPTAGDGDAVDITPEIQRFVESSGVKEGQAAAFVRGSTAAITTMEYEPGGVQDLRAMLERLIPSQGDYEHNRLNSDTNSHAHQRASLVGPSLSVPVIDGHLTLGTWQQIVLLDFDDRPRERTVVVQIFT